MTKKHPFFKQNPELDLKTVRTVDGETEYLTHCKKMPDGYYYVKGKHLELVDDDWVRIVPKVYDHELKKEVIQTSHLIYGVISIDESGNHQLGYFSRNPYTNCRISRLADGDDKTCMDYKMLDEKYFAESLAYGTYYHRGRLSSSDLKTITTKCIGKSNNDRAYNVMDSNSGFEKYKQLYEGSVIRVDKDLHSVSSYLKGITFGAELETINGTLPDHICNQYGVIICKDGSTKDREGHYPPEYVTVPLTGSKGLQVLRNLPKEIQKRSDIDIKCSYHLHLGGFAIDRIFMVSLFKLCCKIQNEVFMMFPHYKTDEVKYANKEKNYCKKLPNVLTSYKAGDFNTYVNNAYEDVYSFLTGGKKFDGTFNMRSKANPWGGHKWDIQTRYYWVNFVNPVFGKQDTIEFRLHTATLNPDKILNWLLMCVAIIKFAQNNSELCLSDKPIKFEKVLDYYQNLKGTPYGAKLTANLIDYYDTRKAYFDQKTKEENYVVPEEFKQDNAFSFPTTKIRSI